jgi:ribonuclease R
MREFLTSKGLSLGGGSKPQPKHYERLLTIIEGRKDAQAIRMILLRSLGQARYSADNNGHFGLSYDAYTHFTSPIRRYPDLLVHRAIRSIIRHPSKVGTISKRIKKLLGLGYDDVRRAETTDTASKPFHYGYNEIEMTELAEHCSVLSRRADKASWDVEAALKCHYMQDKVGEQFTGIISTVTHFGLFIELLDSQIEGLVHINALGNEHFKFDAASQTLTAESSKRRYEIGDNIEVVIARVDMETHKIEFGIPATSSPKGGAKKRKRRD